MSKITANYCEDNGFTIMELHHIYFSENFRDFERLFWMAASKVIATDKNKVGIKVTNIASTDVILMSLV